MDACRSNCPTDSELSEYALGKLAGERSRLIEVQLDRCAQCQERLQQIDDREDSLVSSLRCEPIESSSDAVIEAMVEDFTLKTRISGQPIQAFRDTDPLENRLLGRYQLHDLIGRGGMGSVLRATHVELEKEVAVKVLSDDQMRNADAVARFRREMKLLGKLSHPNVVNASDAGVEDGVCFLAMELIDGLDLSKVVMRSGPLRIADTCEVVRQVAVGLQHAHEHGLVHRDMKPSNIMLTRSGRVKVMDLGLARLTQGETESAGASHGLTLSGQIMGTVDYMSPEQVANSHAADIRTDIYSMGATLYRLLTGRFPFGDDRFDSVLSKLSALATKDALRVSSFRADIPASLEAIVHRCLAKDPEARFAEPHELAKALEPFCDGHDLAALVHRADQVVEPAVEAALQATLPPGGGDTIIATDGPSHADAGGLPKWLLGMVCAAVAVVVLTVSLGIFGESDPKTTATGSSRISQAGESREQVAQRGQADPFERSNQDEPEIQAGEPGLLVVTHDGAGETLTWNEAMAQAEAGDRISLTPHHPEQYPNLEITTSGITLLGNCSTIDAIRVGADDVTIDSVEAVCVLTKSDEVKPKNLTIRNSRLYFVRLRPGCDATLENCVTNYHGGGGTIRARHCTFTAVGGPSDSVTNHEIRIDPFSDLEFENCIFAGRDAMFSFMQWDGKPNRVRMDHCLIHGGKRQSVQVAPYTEDWIYDQVEELSTDELSDLDFQMTNSIVSQSPRFSVAGEQSWFNSFQLLPDSPAKKAGSDGEDLGAIPDRYGWPLKVLHNDVRALTPFSRALRSIGVDDREPMTLRVSHDAGRASLTWEQAMEVAIPGDRIAFHPSRDTYPACLVSVPNVTVLGNYQSIARFDIAADSVTIDAAQSGAIQILPLRTRIRGVRIRNCRMDKFRSAPDAGSVLENCVGNFGGGSGEVSAVHCTFVQVRQGAHSILEFSPLSKIKMRDCILVSNETAMVTYMPSEEDPPIRLDHCLLYGRQGNRIWFKEFDGNWHYDGARFVDFEQVRSDRFHLNNCVLDHAPEFVNFEEEWLTDFHLKRTSPAVAAASDGLDMGAIEDANLRGWPLQPNRVASRVSIEASDQLRGLPYISQ
ncbi:MAG: protein kinase [Planctomycetota bacterium]